MTMQRTLQLGTAIALALLMSYSPARATVRVEDWGATPAGLTVHLYTLSHGNIRVQLTEYGTRIVSIEAPDRQGKTADIVLGYNNLAQYLFDPKDYFGAVVGRYGNRIAHETFSLAGHVYHVPINNNGNACMADQRASAVKSGGLEYRARLRLSSRS